MINTSWAVCHGRHTRLHDCRRDGEDEERLLTCGERLLTLTARSIQEETFARTLLPVQWASTPEEQPY